MLLSTVLLCAALPQLPAKDLVEVALRGEDEAAFLMRVASDFDDHHGVSSEGIAVIYADDREQEYLRSLGFRLEVVQEDLTRFYAERAAADPGMRSAMGSMGGFRTLAEIEQEMDRLASTYPGQVSPKFSIGTSIQGRDIWAMRVSDNPSIQEAGEPTAWFDAIHHAREPMSGESLLLYADHLGSNYGSDPRVTRLVDTRNNIFIPCANPDGYEYNRQIAPNGGGMWRKNRRNNGGGSYGVDMNRNYDWEWGPQWGGSSGSPSSETYRGTAPFSEPETQGLRDYLAIAPPGVSVSAHSYSNLWLYPWGYDTIYTVDDPIFRAYGARFTANNGWPYGTGWEVLYIANGVADDYHYGQHGSISFTPEIGSGSDGFWPAPSRILPLFNDVLPAYLLISEYSGASAEIIDQIWTEVSGDGDPYPEPGESWSLELRVENLGVLGLGALLQLTSNHPEVTVLQSSGSVSVGPFASNLSSAFQLSFSSSAQVGTPYALDLDLDFEGLVTTEPLSIVLGQPRVLAYDDMETADFGWQVSNQNNYSWERADPQQTSTGGQTAQPGNDNTPGGTLCWVTGAAAGSSVGANDVDGVTVLTSPIFSAAGFAHVELEYARWFANLPGGPLDDRLLVEVSSDGGGSWTTLENIPNANSWQLASFSLEDYVPLTSTMRLRVTASDSPNNDITESCFDDVTLSTFSNLPTLGAWGEVSLGSQVRLQLSGPAGAFYEVWRSFTVGPGTPVAGIEGLLFLTGNIKTLLTGTFDAGGESERLVNVPNNANLSGRTVHLQIMADQGGPEAAFSNLLSVTIL